MAALAAVFVIHLRCFFVIPLTGLDMFASDIETCKHVSASLGSIVIPASERESPISLLIANRGSQIAKSFTSFHDLPSGLA